HAIPSFTQRKLYSILHDLPDVSVIFSLIQAGAKPLHFFGIVAQKASRLLKKNEVNKPLSFAPLPCE
ncbi:hypothetical protein MUP42_00295, partial [Candidatus Bathyarchaeota archaeon]|nr:hypothetical protein [Candidatus Bathyarchaeota archaeon]